MDFDYKKYSLEKLEEWVHDAMSGDASPHEIYSTIREVVRENYYYHKEHTGRAYGLLELLSGHRPVADKSVLSCDKDDPSPECKGAWNDFWEDQSQSLHVSEDGDIFAQYNAENTDKVVKWQLPVEVDGASGEYFVQFPDDLLEAANLKEGDQVEWIDQKNGSYLLKKV